MASGEFSFSFILPDHELSVVLSKYLRIWRKSYSYLDLN
jgi:hypothetical protein